MARFSKAWTFVMLVYQVSPRSLESMGVLGIFVLSALFTILLTVQPQVLVLEPVLRGLGRVKALYVFMH